MSHKFIKHGSSQEGWSIEQDEGFVNFFHSLLGLRGEKFINGQRASIERNFYVATAAIFSALFTRRTKENNKEKRQSQAEKNELSFASI
jgi:hypothetical protein